jgi:AraC-like DNA-binding protein
MSKPSNWPLPDAGIRFLTPAFMVEQLARHPLTRECYPTAMGHYPVARGHQMRRRRHDDNLLIYCTAGRGRLSAGGQVMDIRAGQVVGLPQGLPHAYEADVDDPWTVYWIHFQGSSTGIFMQHLGFSEDQRVFDVGVTPALVAALENLLGVRHTGYSLPGFIEAANLLRYLLTEFAGTARSQRSRHAQGLDLERIQAFMREHLDRSLNLDTLAAQASLSKYHFSNSYRRLTGYSPIRHFLNMKMEHACNLLDGSNMGIAKIARQVGYEDPLYFSRQFRKTMGVSPRDYRGSIRG